MIALVSFFVIIIISIITVRIGAVALELTGIPQDIAAFQAQSAFSGTGFTTGESEAIVSHPLRRKIVRILIMLGSAGLTSSIATFIIAFVGKSSQVVTTRGLILILGMVLVFLFAKSKFIYRIMKSVITKMLTKSFSSGVYDYYEVLGLGEGYGISTFKVIKNSWLANKTIQTLGIGDEGIIILSIKRKENNRDVVIGAPSANTKIKVGDEMFCYGLTDDLKCLSERLKGKKGNEEHRMFVDMNSNLSEDAPTARTRTGGK